MRRVEETVPLPTARKRALFYLSARSRLDLTKANSVGYSIWPGVNMKSQGAGGAASRILRGLQKDGLVKWDANTDMDDWGWQITAEGLTYLREHSND